MAMRFRHLKLTSKQSVGVYRSKIHKRGLFCHRDIESGEMVIEYAGEVCIKNLMIIQQLITLFLYIGYTFNTCR